MILYVNGDSHSAAAEAAVPFGTAEEEFDLWWMGRAPHPENLKVSYGAHLAATLKARLICEAEAGGSNRRIIRTTKAFLENNPVREEVFVIIGWTDWSRDEWLHEGKYINVNPSGIKSIPDELATQYKEWCINQADNLVENTIYWHNEIWNFHKELEEKKIKHLFFNCWETFDDVPFDQRKDWGNNYLTPYSPEQAYCPWSQGQGFKPVTPEWFHFGKEAHKAWANNLIKPLTKLL